MRKMSSKKSQSFFKKLFAKDLSISTIVCFDEPLVILTGELLVFVFFDSTTATFTKEEFKALFLSAVFLSFS